MGTNEMCAERPTISVLCREAVVLAIDSFSRNLLRSAITPKQREIGEEVIDIGGKIRYRYDTGRRLFVASVVGMREKVSVRFEEIRDGSRLILLRPNISTFTYLDSRIHNEYKRLNPCG
ncbi:MAG: hypothetical protein HGA31_00340 [Candidatus Moranbacteria bacterium]|nr:hypothetical protein [Candidatus Moranbacteria bacterium]